MSTKSKQVNIRLGENVYQALEQEAQMTGGTISDIVRRAITDRLDGTSPPKPLPGDIFKITLPGLKEYTVKVQGSKDMKAGDDAVTASK